MMMKKTLTAALLALLPLAVSAQIGEHRNTLSVGAGVGYNLSSVSFTPKVPQGMKGGMTVGATFRYTVEKYFSTIASIQAEINYSQMGWKEDIKDIDDQPVINSVTGLAEEYSRTISYVQIPVMAHLAWGRETKGMNFFVNAGPQLGIYLSESSEMNFDLDQRNVYERANSVIAQDTMKVENKFDYGITAGVGMEYSHPKLGHFTLEARYYYGLGNLYGDSKRDYFGSSNFSNICIKFTWLTDILK